MERITLIFLAAAAACSGPGSYVWADDYAGSAGAVDVDAYHIAAGDLVAVSVYGQEGMSARSRVRQDGKISLPFLHEVQAQGYLPQVLAEQIEARLKDYIKAPVVTVTVEESRPLNVPVLGEVARPGQYTLDRGAGILDALAAAGGLTEFAHRDRIFLLRRQPGLVRIRSTFAALSRGEGRAVSLRLQNGDCIVVE